MPLNFPPHLTDCHAHDPSLWPHALISVSPKDYEKLTAEYPEAFFSVGIHPWWASEASPKAMEMLATAAGQPRVLAIGEAGLDKLRGPALEEQIAVFKPQIALSEKVHKPLIIHLVRAWDELLALRRELRPQQPWIIHGFRGKPRQAQQLLSLSGNPLYLSCGPSTPAETFNYILQNAPSRLLGETDAQP